MLAMLLALLGMVALTTLHDASPHLHDADHIAGLALGDDHDTPQPDEQNSATDPLHTAAHAASQSVNIPAQLLLAGVIAPVAPRWSWPPPVPGSAHRPTAILRPPRV